MRNFTSFLLFLLLIVFNFTVLAQWTQTPGLTSDRITAFGVSGTNLFAGTNESEIFLSTDNGTHWQARNMDFSSWTPVSAFAFVGSYIIAASDSALGIYRSSDNGKTWEGAASGLTNHRVSSLAVKGTNLFAGTKGGGVYLSIDNGSNWTQVRHGLTNLQILSLAVSGDNIFAGTLNGGVFRSGDNGANWTQVNHGLTNLLVYSLLSRGTELFAGTFGGGVFLTTDNGANWSQINTGLTDARIFALASIGPNLFAGTAGGGVNITTNNGASWTAVNSGLPENTSVTAFAVMGINLFMSSYSGGFFLTNDFGTNWTQITSGLTTSYVTSLAVSGSDLFAGTDTAGVFISTDNGAKWIKVNNGLTNKKITSLAVMGTDIFAGTDSGGVFRSTDNGANWTAVNDGLTDLYILSLFVNGSNLYAGTFHSGACLSTNGGTSWTPINNGMLTMGVRSFAVIGPYLFAGSVGVYRSTDNGTSWTLVNNGLDRESVTSLAVIGTTLFAGLDMGGGTYKTTDYGDNWTFERANFIYAFAVKDKGLFQGSASRGVEYSSDMGENWTSVNEGLPDHVMIYSLALNGTTLFAGSLYNGLWMRPLSEMIAPPPPVIPGIPKLIRPPDNAINVKEDMRCIWGKSDFAEMYKICIAEDMKFKNLLFCDSLKDTLKEVKGLKQGSRYQWKVKAINQSGSSEYSETWSFTTFLDAPEGLKAEVLSKNRIKLSWKAVANESAKYVLERKLLQGKAFDAIDTTKAGATSYIDTTVKAPAEYYYRIKAFTPYAVSKYSNQVKSSITVFAEVCSIPQNYLLEQNYPNPFNPVTMLKYALPEESYIKISVYDLLGKLIGNPVNSVQPAGYYAVSFEARNLPSGMYIYVIEARPVKGSRGFTEARKMILLR